MKILRAGILGCGHFAHRHAQIITNLPEEIELVAFCDRNPPKTQAFIEQYAPGKGIAFTEHRAMFEQAKLDIVIICLPPYGHTDEVDLAAQNGVHILIEKPIALSSEQGWHMVEVAERANIKTQVGFMYRFGEAVEQFKAQLDSGEIGTAGLMNARYFCNALHSNWWRMKDKSGGQVMEQAIHLFDLMRFFMGEPTAVYSRQENLFHHDVPDYTIEDVSATVVSFRGGGIGVVAATNAAIPGKWQHDYRVVAHKMTAEFSHANIAMLHPTHAPDQTPITINSSRDIYLHQMQDLIRAIRTDSNTLIPLREGAKSLDLVLAANRSAAIHQEVAL